MFDEILDILFEILLICALLAMVLCMISLIGLIVVWCRQCIGV